MKKSKPLKIIIADDDRDDRELLKFLFNANERFELIGCFDSGLDVIEEIIGKKNVPDILLIDMVMPFLTGIEVLEKLDENRAAPKLHTFIISTTINAAEEKKHLENPAINFIKKPITLVDINDLPGLILEGLHVRNDLKI